MKKPYEKHLTTLHLGREGAKILTMHDAFITDKPGIT
jgi:hypothetical protein